MEELRVKAGPFTGSAQEFDRGVKNSIETQREEFVRTGWFLRSAEETGLYRELGYKSLTEYAEAELNLKKEAVSRYKNINRKYSEGGYSEFLKEEYRGYGVGKLGDMLKLSDEVIQSLSKELTRKEIQEVKREIEKEKEITDLEVMMEPIPERPEFDTLVENTLYQYLKENKEEFKKIYPVIEQGGEKEEVTEKLLDIIAPSGIAAKTVRIPGKGKIMISIKGKDEKVDFLNVRTNEKESENWGEVIHFIDAILKFTDYQGNMEQTYQDLYGEPLTVPEEKQKEPEIAPMQQESKAAEPIESREKQPEIEREQSEHKTEWQASELEEQEVESVTGKVEKDRELEELKEVLAEAFIKRYYTRLEYSENMKDEVYAILDKVHRSQWILEYKEEEYFVVEEAGYIKLRQGEEIITTVEWMDFYELMHKVYWKEKEISVAQSEETKGCTGATEEEILPGQMEVADYPEVLPESIESNYDKWLRKKPELEARVEKIRKAILTDDYAAVEWEARRLVELMEE